MPTVVLYTEGTLGDHLPFIALGQALTARGHRARLVINRAFHPYAQQAGLEAVALTDIERGPEHARQYAWAWDHWRNPEAAAHPNAPPFDLSQFVSRARQLAEFCRQADLLVATSIRPLGLVVQGLLARPWLTVSLNPYSFWQPVAPAEREGWRQARIKEYRQLSELIAAAWAELGVDRLLPPWSPGWLLARHALLASSPHFSQPDPNQLQPQASLDLTGFWFYQDPAWAGWQPDPALAEFCARRPLVLAFSSQPLENPAATLALHVEAAARLNMPLLVQRGWADFSAEALPPGTNRDQVMFADFLPHDWLFAQAAAAIQHGGIGSIARALRQGCPLLIEPYGNDQFYNASRVVELGVGATLHPFQLTVDDLVQLLAGSVLAPETRRRAVELAAKFQAEDGLATAVEMIERYLARFDAQGRLPTLYEQFAPPLTPRRRRPFPTPPPPSSPPPPSLQLEPAPVTSLTEQQSAIPKILHQTWKNADVPPHLAAFRQSWQTHQPDWEFRLWTDQDNREFMRRYYGWFLPIYDGYPEEIMRADAVRYFILHHYGGVYADLDVECLRPIEPLLAGQQLLFGLEHPAHLATPLARHRSLRQIIGNAVMAAAPGHPFWERLFKQLIAFHRAPGPLDATGPFMLTRACASLAQPGAIKLVPAELFYPISIEQPWANLSPEQQARVTQTAYTIHHWQGGWWRETAAQQPHQARLSLVLRGQVVNVLAMQLEQYRALLAQTADLPRVSGLMVTQNRAALAQRAIHCFRRQSYPNRELVILDDGQDDTLEEWVNQLGDERIVFVRLPAEGKPLGELRNMAVARAGGQYVAQWDDDDLSDPLRLELQLAVVHVLQVDACALEREQLWWPQRRRLAYSTRRLWEGSLVCAKAKLPPYPTLRRGEDTPVSEQLLAHGRLALLDLPQLYTYVFHQANTFEAEHWEEHWLAATESFEGDLYTVMLQGLQQRLQLELTTWPALAPGLATPAAGVTAQRVRLDAPAGPPARTTWPKILLLVPVKDAAPYLAHFWANLRGLTYPHDRLTLAFLESDSLDQTYPLIEQNLPALQAEFAGAKLFKRDYAYRSDLPRWEPSQQYRRRSIMAKSRNYLLAQALADEEWVLWIDVDVARWPNDVIEQLLAADKEIVAPNCLALRTGETFDYNTFKLKPEAGQLDWSPYLIDGILQPPKGYGRLYLADLRQHDLVEVDAVGGTMLLIKADLHREGLNFPTFSYKHHIETEGLARLAKDMGYRCWGLPRLEIFHP